MDKKKFNQMFSCPCLYDECVISCYLNENLEEIESRIFNVVKSNYWLVQINLLNINNNNNDNNINNKTFVTCISHATRMLDNLVLTSTDHAILVANCIRSDHGTERNMSCFRFYFEDRMPAIGFCLECRKHFVARTPHTFLLHRVKINNGNNESEKY